jgi:hypothetical protein
VKYHKKDGERRWEDMVKPLISVIGAFRQDVSEFPMNQFDCYIHEKRSCCQYMVGLNKSFFISCIKGQMYGPI